MAEKKTKKEVSVTKTKSPVKKTVAKPAKEIGKSIETGKKSTIKVVEPKEVATSIKDTFSVDVYGLDGKVSGKVNIPTEIFKAKVNATLMAQAVRVYLATQRSGTSSTKTRSEVSGTTKKMYRQKGTGRARHGAAKAPIFVGGGIAFGPRPKSFALTLPKKMRRKALFSALTSKYSENNLRVLDTSQVSGKTKEMVETFKNLGLTKKVTIIVTPEEKQVARAARNIKGVTVEHAANLNTYSVLNSNTVVFAKDALNVLQSTFLK
ncbi:MAG: 50S ribosomal protein L4 [Candidatus Levybacteria bacterium]|nr:50S ribosomal protein L4 [Candidatus Levybacteria bacterium]MBP9814857.1 50S ribosomal protein L4 [Candidatus Levybacteria bacterium]